MSDFQASGNQQQRAQENANKQHGCAHFAIVGFGLPNPWRARRWFRQHRPRNRRTI
jgi:hypothetical protein